MDKEQENELNLDDPRIQSVIDDAVREQTEGLKRKRDELLGEGRKLKDANRTTDDVDVEEYERLKAEAQQREEDEAKKRGEFEKLIQQKQEKHGREMETVKTEAQRWRDRYVRHRMENEAIRAIAAHKGAPELLLPHISQRVRTIEEDGDVSFEILGRNGEPMLGDNGERASFDDLVKEFRMHDVFGRAFEPSTAPGTGARPNAKKGQRNPWAKDTQNLTEQGRMMRENPALAAEMKKAAGL